MADALCLLSGISPVFPDKEQQEYAPTAGVCSMWAVSSRDLLAGRSGFMIKAVFNRGVKYWREMPFILLVLVLCTEIPLSPATRTGFITFPAFLCVTTH